MTLTKCDHRWKAPYLLAPTAPREIRVGAMTVPVRGDTVYVDQRCVLPKDHEGVHRSERNVIA